LLAAAEKVKPAGVPSSFKAEQSFDNKKRMSFAMFQTDG
jgi:hypothetical protein